jgi:hypothetical protein
MAMDFILDGHSSAPKISLSICNRIDADTSLVECHEISKGSKPPPQKTEFMPLRTRLTVKLFSNGRSHLTNEQLDSIPAFSIQQKSEYSTRRCYAVHPVTYHQVCDVSNKVLHDLADWIEITSPNELSTRKAKQVPAFKAARNKLLDGIRKELRKRDKNARLGQSWGIRGIGRYLLRRKKLMRDRVATWRKTVTERRR